MFCPKTIITSLFSWLKLCVYVCTESDVRCPHFKSIVFLLYMHTHTHIFVPLLNAYWWIQYSSSRCSWTILCSIDQACVYMNTYEFWVCMNPCTPLCSSLSFSLALSFALHLYAGSSLALIISPLWIFHYTFISLLTLLIHYINIWYCYCRWCERECSVYVVVLKCSPTIHLFHFLGTCQVYIYTVVGDRFTLFYSSTIHVAGIYMNGVRVHCRTL